MCQKVAEKCRKVPIIRHNWAQFSNKLKENGVCYLLIQLDILWQSRNSGAHAKLFGCPKKDAHQNYFRKTPKSAQLCPMLPNCAQLRPIMPSCAEIMIVPNCAEMCRNVPKCAQMCPNIFGNFSAILPNYAQYSAQFGTFRHFSAFFGNNSGEHPFIGQPNSLACAPGFLDCHRIANCINK
jgi:hypothetical protein